MNDELLGSGFLAFGRGSLVFLGGSLREFGYGFAQLIIMHWCCDKQKLQYATAIIYSQHELVLNEGLAASGFPSRWNLKVMRESGSALYCSMYSKKWRIACRKSLKSG